MEFSSKLEVFERKYIGKFDTPKKLNRSTKEINAKFVADIEQGTVLSAEIQKINNVPIFVYKTCLTIHGNFPEIQNSYAGYYKNIIQNKNGSLEIRYSAIDNDAKKELLNILSLFGWNRKQDSTNGLFFEKPYNTTNKDEALHKLREFKNYVSEFKCEGMKANVFASGCQYFGTYWVYLSIIPLTIQGDIKNIASKILNIPLDEINSKIAESDKINAELEQQWKARQEINQRKAEEKEVKRRTEIDRLIKDCGFRQATTYDKAKTYMHVQINDKDAFAYVFYKDNKFNNLKRSKNMAPTDGEQYEKSPINKTDLKSLIDRNLIIFKF